MDTKVEPKEVRCLEKGRLYFKIVPELNLIEIKCRDCAKVESKRMNQSVDVFEHYDMGANWVETIIRPKPKEKGGDEQ